MRLFLTRQLDGSYMLTRCPPVLAPVLGTALVDAYIQVGEPIGLRHLCAGGTHAVFGRALEPLESVRVNLELEEVQSDADSS